MERGGKQQKQRQTGFMKKHICICENWQLRSKYCRKQWDSVTRDKCFSHECLESELDFSEEHSSFQVNQWEPAYWSSIPCVLHHFQDIFEKLLISLIVTRKTELAFFSSVEEVCNLRTSYRDECGL
jgi:hypothetical protein